VKYTEVQAEFEVAYFDHNATTPADPRVIAAMLEVMSRPYNASSIHKLGRAANTIVNNARAQIKEALNIPEEYAVIFTASGTEANNLALSGMRDYKIVTSGIEHPSVLKVAGEGLIPVDPYGVIRLESLERIITQHQRNFPQTKLLISIMLANNETGVIQPLKEVVKVAHLYGAVVHTDATQAVGKILVDFADLGVDMMTVSAHKFGGPVGVGALIFKKALPLQSIMRGGGQEYRYRPGTHNIAAIRGMGMASALLEERLVRSQAVKQIRDYIESSILQISPESIIFGKGASRIPNTTSITMPGIDSQTQVIYFDLQNFAVSAGAACSVGRVDIARVQMVMGYSQETAASAIRISLGPGNTQVEAENFVQAWKELYAKSPQRNIEKVKEKIV
jgi:cysteine desulfurase